MFPSPAAPGLADSWASGHRHVPLTLLACDVHYLRSIALAVDDDLVSHLLLKKLRLATVATADAMPADVVRMNSYVDYSIDGGETRFCQLLHPSSSSIPGYGLSIASLAGAGLVGLRAGQTIMWPDADGTMRCLSVSKVATCSGLDRWLAADPASPAPPRSGQAS